MHLLILHPIDRGKFLKDAEFNEDLNEPFISDWLEFRICLNDSGLDKVYKLWFIAKNLGFGLNFIGRINFLFGN